MIDEKFIGYELPARKVVVERGQLKLFCKAIGESNSIYLEETAAREAGFAGLPVPPTFPMSLSLLAEPASSEVYEAMGVDKTKLLHGEQEFRYLSPIYVGDELSLRCKISDIYQKNDGALEFIVYDTVLLNQQDKPVVEMQSVTVVRN